MKKMSLMVLIFVLLCGCSDSNLEESQTVEVNSVVFTETPTAKESSEENYKLEFSWELIESRVPLVTYNDLQTGEYNEKLVLLKCIFKDISFSGLNGDMVSFETWVENDGTYYHDGMGGISLDKGIVGAEELRQGKSGDSFLLYTKVYKDGSFSTTEAIAIKKIESDITWEDVTNSYKAACTQYSCEEILRNPEQYGKELARFSGAVFQIVEESESRVEFLLDTGEENGIVFIYYERNEGEERLLENDNVTVYGALSPKLKNYKTPIGTEKSVVKLSGEFVE